MVASAKMTTGECRTRSHWRRRVYELQTDPWVRDEFIRRGGKLQPADVRATPLACVGEPIGAALALVRWLAFGLWPVAIAIVVLMLALNFWASGRGIRDLNRNNRILAEILADRDRWVDDQLARDQQQRERGIGLGGWGGLRAGGISPKVVQEQLGHTDLSTTLRYTQV